MTAADVVRTPDELRLPEEHAMQEVFAALQPDGAAVFTREIIEAVSSAKERNDFRPVQDVITSWYWSLQFGRRPELHEAVEWANAVVAGPETGMPLEKVLHDLGLPQPSSP